MSNPLEDEIIYQYKSYGVVSNDTVNNEIVNKIEHTNSARKVMYVFPLYVKSISDMTEDINNKYVELVDNNYQVDLVNKLIAVTINKIEKIMKLGNEVNIQYNSNIVLIVEAFYLLINSIYEKYIDFIRVEVNNITKDTIEMYNNILNDKRFNEILNIE